MSNYSLNGSSLETVDLLSHQVTLGLARAQAQELAKLIGEDTLALISQVWSVNDEILSEVKAAGIPVESELRALIMNARGTDVRNALEALKEALEEGRADHPVQFFKKAIIGKWKPNFPKKQSLSL